MGLFGLAGLVGGILLSGAGDKGFQNVRNKQIIELGTWNNEPIEWLVVSETDKGILLLSLNVLFRRRYHEKRVECTWKMSDIRKYLNETFFQEAFTETERKRIYNRYVGERGDDDTVFLLSRKEAEEYLWAAERATPNKESWILRSMSYSPYYVNSVYGGEGGIISDSQEISSITSSGIRPSVYLKK